MKRNQQLELIKRFLGEKIRSWEVLAYAGTKDRKHKVWCKCACGAVRRLYWWSLKDGQSKDCGCTSMIGKVAHGHSNPNGKETPEYRCWVAMMKRAGRNRAADSVHDHIYRNRGIFVCERWESFENFLADMGPRPSLNHTIDRINNDKGYDPSNCRWVTPKEQGRNMRNNRRFEFQGQSHIIPEWAEITGIHKETIKSRLRHGWSLERALTESVHA